MGTLELDFPRNPYLEPSFWLVAENGDLRFAESVGSFPREMPTAATRWQPCTNQSPLSPGGRQPLVCVSRQWTQPASCRIRGRPAWVGIFNRSWKLGALQGKETAVQTAHACLC